MSATYNLLILEDETIASHYLKQLLLSLGDHAIYVVSNAKDALEIIQTIKFHFAFVDINIQGSIDGIECAKMINEKCFLPIIFTTAYNDTNTIAEASLTNMYGYLMKPFEKKDLEVAFQIALNRVRMTKAPTEDLGSAKNEIQLSDHLLFSFTSQTLFANELPVNLTKKELAILSILATGINQNISYETIKETIWGNKEISNSTIRDTIRRLRTKSPDLDIHSISGFGYMLKG